MAKYKSSSKRPQAKHKKNKKSQHDKGLIPSRDSDFGLS